MDTNQSAQSVDAYVRLFRPGLKHLLGDEVDSGNLTPSSGSNKMCCTCDVSQVALTRCWMNQKSHSDITEAA